MNVDCCPTPCDRSSEGPTQLLKFKTVSSLLSHWRLRMSKLDPEEIRVQEKPSVRKLGLCQYSSVLRELTGSSHLYG